MQRIVIIGSGTAGTIMASRLARLNRRAIRARTLSLTVVDRDGPHLYQPGLLFMPFGKYAPADLTRPRRRGLPRGATFVPAAVDRIDADRKAVVLEDGHELLYDVLIVASGSHVAPEETDGLLGAGWRERMHEFYTLDGALALRDALKRFSGGRLVVSIAEMPIKCPVAPIEFAFLADAYFTERGIRDKVTIDFVTPLDGCFTKPVATRELSHLLAEKGINVTVEFNTGEVDGAAGIVRSYDGREVPFDLLVTIPVHKGAAFVGRTPGLGDELDFVRTDPATLQSALSPAIFALGDATNIPASKAGSVAHFEAELLAPNIQRYLRGKPMVLTFDGHSNCFIETGHGKALLIDFNYEVEPLPGRFPSRLGPLSLLKESRLNHLGKLAFRWVYWNLLLPGRNIPFVPARMQMRGKRRPPPLPHSAA
ncbi:MAG: FAD/NAD(P)-binding oxidoreductase [Gemmatimonadota bacterium]|nr:FAD/NAD(P)-binding oxidoreductase [Gemmatimonadota bacterium]